MEKLFALKGKDHHLTFMRDDGSCDHIEENETIKLNDKEQLRIKHMIDTKELVAVSIPDKKEEEKKSEKEKTTK